MRIRRWPIGSTAPGSAVRSASCLRLPRPRPARLCGQPRGGMVLDVGTGTGRAALVLAEAGARATAVDASAEMLRVAERGPGARFQSSRSAIGDAHHLAFRRQRLRHGREPARVDAHTRLAAVRCRGLPRLMWRAIVDYPAAPAWRRSKRPAATLAHRLGPAPSRTACSPTARSATSSGAMASGSPASIASSSCRLRCTSDSASLAVTTGLERALAAVGLLAAGRLAGHDRGGAVKVLVTGATGFTGGHLARFLARARPRRPRAGSPAATRRRPAGGRHRGRRRRSPRRRQPAGRSRRASTSSTTSRRCIGRRACPSRRTAP